MTRDERLWPILAVVAAIGTGYVIYALATGRVRGKYNVYSRTEKPGTYWMGVTTYGGMMAVCWYLVGKALVDWAAQP